MTFLVYDIIFLVLFATAIGLFLYSGRKNIKKEGLLLLYKAQWGVKLIDYVGKKYKRTLDFLAYVSIGLGYILMAVMIYLFGKIIYIYAIMPSIVQAIKVPPIMPLIPYLPQVFKLDFLPPFYFTYWILILALVAIPHEFFHGIFMRRYGVKIKSTGFGFFPFFLPVFLAAFVEQDEKSFEKSSKFNQMTILSAGTFANILTALFFFFVMWGFFSLAFAPAGVMFDTYSYSPVAVAGITMVNGVTLQDASYDGILDLMDEDLNEIKFNDKTYLISKEMFEPQKGKEIIMAFDDAPAIRAGLPNVITEINGVAIDSKEKLALELENYDAGDEIIVKSVETETSVVLGEYPSNNSRAWLGVGFMDKSREGILGKIYVIMSSFKDPNTYYSANYEVSEFIYNLLWWLVLICISVALVNMLPVGIFDGGRFFYLTIWKITRSEKIAQRSFKFVTWLFLFLLAVLMAFWFVSFF